MLRRFWEWNHSKIEVEYFDAATGALLGRTKLAVDRLPMSFEAETTLHIRDRNYTVVEAIPMTAAEFRRSGKLKLALREQTIAHVDPREILFSLPTICDGLPSIAPGSSKLDRRVLELHEDDWRQREFISRRYQGQIDHDLTEIRRIHREERVGLAFRSVHLRQAITRPLFEVPRLTDDLIVALAATRLDGISFQKIAGTVHGGFALALLCGLTLYGQVDDRRLASLCVGPFRANNVSTASTVALLAAFADEHNLCLLDWCRAEQITPEDLGAYVEGLN